MVGLDADAPGSVSGIVRRQAELLAARFDVTLVARSIPLRPETYRAVTVAAPTFHVLRRFSHVAREWVASRALVRATLALDARTPLDVVVFHTHTLAALGARALAARGTRTVLVAHSDIRKRPSGAYDPLLTRLYRWSNPAAYRRVDRVVALSRDFAEVARSDARGAGAVVEIPCPVAGPWPAVPHRAAVEPGAALRLGFAGRLAIEKGLPFLLLAFERLAAERPGCRLLLAGDGNLRGELESRVRDRALGARVEFLGWRSGAELERFYREIDLLCLPSISENQGVAAQEALLRGVPVVASKVGGLSDSIRPGLDGELCAPADAGSLYDALRRATATLAASGYTVPDPEWMERFSPAGHLRAFGQLIEGLVA